MAVTQQEIENRLWDAVETGGRLWVGYKRVGAP